MNCWLNCLCITACFLPNNPCKKSFMKSLTLQIVTRMKIYLVSNSRWFTSIQCSLVNCLQKTKNRKKPNTKSIKNLNHKMNWLFYALHWASHLLLRSKNWFKSTYWSICLITFLKSFFLMFKWSRFQIVIYHWYSPNLMSAQFNVFCLIRSLSTRYEWINCQIVTLPIVEVRIMKDFKL